MTPDLQALKKQFAEEFQLEQVPEERRDALLEQMGEAFIKRLFLATMEKIGESGVTEYEGLLDRGASAEEIEAFFEKSIPGYNVFVREVAQEFTEEMKKNLGGL
ncbi:MAG: hypothetical protein A2808_01370 [Candidatus Moranbacteria bacterium RIFCSPHIGHO2_01_FULL_55_24]|nr:MAG: hypothetical protein A2808_01370 [Candidatus Moranbacteria bacterium RIFCSPHIGHO2_01_FULL_55_24]